GFARASEHGRVREAAWAASLLGAPSLLTAVLRPQPGQESRLAERAVELLHLAVARGYKDFAAMQNDADLEGVRGRASYLELVRRIGLDRHYVSVWRGDASQQAEVLQGLSAEAHLARCRVLAAEGYRPVALSLVTLAAEKKPIAASVWNRPVNV